MLQPPGSSTGRSKNYQHRRKAQESPEQVLRGLQRLTPNKRCADCNSKLPSCINLTVGTFVCISCAGIHREHNHRVKGLGHSSFTQEEAEQMKNSDNDKVNKIYLARFNPATERLRQPQDNSDLQLLRAWIKRKYHDKAWYRDEGGGLQQQPTMAKIPPKQKQAQQPQGDLLGAFSAPAPAPNQGGGGGWDAFGGSSQNQAFQANFGPPQQQLPPQQQQGFAADFANFSSAPAPQQQQGFANFGQQPPAQQQQGFADFQQQQQPPQQQQGFANFGQQQQQPPQQQNQQGFANFNQQQQPPQQQNQQGFANFSQQQQQAPQQQQGFANFNQQQQPPQHQNQQGFANFNQQQQQPPQQQNQQQDFANFNQQKQQQPPQQQSQQGFANFNQQQQQPPQQQSQQGFANFNQQQPQQSAPPQQQQGQGGFANFSQPSPPQGQAQAGFASFNQQPPQQGSTQPQQQAQQDPQQNQTQAGFASFGQQQPQQVNPPQQQQGGFASFNQQHSAPPQQQQQQGGFANFGQQQQPNLQQQQGFTNVNQQQQPPQQQQQGGFANFGQQQQLQPPTPQKQPQAQGQDQQQQQQGGFGSFNQQQPSSSAAQPQPAPGSFGNFNQQPQQQPATSQPPQQQPPPLQPNMSAQQQEQQSQQNGGMAAFGQLGQQEPQGQTNQSAISNMQNLSLSQPLASPSETTEKAESGTGTPGGGDKPSSMQMESKRSFEIPSPTKEMLAPAPATASSAPSEVSLSVKSQKGVPKYSKGQEVYYRNSTRTAKATIVKVHFDDDLEPFYTVTVDGKEKQTDDAHLFADHPIQSDIVKVLKDMSESQLQQVLQYVKQIGQPETTSGSVTPRSETPSRTTAMSQPVSSSPMPNISMSPHGQGQNANNVSLSPVPAPMPAPAPAPFPSGPGMSTNATGGIQGSDASNAGDNAPVMSAQPNQPSTSGMNPSVMGNNQGFSIPDLTPQTSEPVAAASSSMMTQNGVSDPSFQQPGFAPQQSAPGQMQQPSFAPQQPINQGGPQNAGQVQHPSMPPAGFGQPQQQPQANQMPLSQQLQQQQQFQQPQMPQPQQQGAAPQGNPFDFY